MPISIPYGRLHVAALAACVVLLPWSTAYLSMAQMLLVAVWLSEGWQQGDLKGRFKRAFTRAPVLLFLSVFAMHVLGLLWSWDPDWGVDLGRILLPVLVFGMVLGGRSPLDARTFRSLLLLGAWSVVASTLVTLLLVPDAAVDYRAKAYFISHIRLALLLAFAVVVFLHYRNGRAWVLLAQLVAAAWCIWYLLQLHSLQGLAILAMAGWVLAWRSLSATTWRSYLLRAALLILPLLGIVMAWQAWQLRGMRISNTVALPERSAGGEVYVHDVGNPQVENGNPVWTRIAWAELHRNWPTRSKLGLSDLDARGHVIYGTLFRYLASLDLPKDSVGLMALSDEDVRRIEAGVANAHSRGWTPLRARVEEVLLEVDQYRSVGDASGHSVTMRLEYLKAGWALARAHWLIGVGTGGTRPAFAAQYERMGTRLRPEYRHRAHQQYLTLWISFGLPAMVWVLFSWWWPAWRLGAWRQPLFLAWALAFGISCFTDDTLETQAGATFFGLYYALLVFAAPWSGTTALAPAEPPPAGDRSP